MFDCLVADPALAAAYQAALAAAPLARIRVRAPAAHALPPRPALAPAATVWARVALIAPASTDSQADLRQRLRLALDLVTGSLAQGWTLVGAGHSIAERAPRRRSR